MKVNAKPLSELSRLEQCLKVASTPFRSAPQQIILNDDNDEPSTLVLQTGIIEIYRRADELLIGIATAPFILGLAAGMQEYRVVAKNPCTGFYLPASTSLQLIQQNSLWKEAFCWLSWIKSILEKRDRQLVGNNSYHQIRAMLLNMAEWDETLRSKIGVMNHIQQSTRISRSVVAEVLAALRQGNYINMSRGKLVSINRLPTEY
ncbi:helix-turn-helix domain-containing protein [Enterobacter cloacae]|uniref:Inhibitor of hydrogen peroxide resistance n=1 Tax=Enterobacter cloacae TaxID=550 RepID=A0A3R8Z7B9_ENTCL|nr:helix-turn-helix domain-containing protein [Enterobacter cloacae]ELK7442015.1 helix-turn-helix domain-containing protein [Enterobacter cloacae]MBG0524205.1 helix-turn-helix domain-containing protein [Enterobacter cloacae]MCE1970984.1 helix-turn-helix domain-containing protein [Enterobacter cloacae]PCM81550.1 transcriptional regulator [Enterobacter cloacae]RSB27168.1 transcriptional regulator [Enterobacter cloacae]